MLRIQRECFWMDGDFQCSTYFSDDFSFTGNTRFIDRDLEVEIIVPFNEGIFTKKIVDRKIWINANKIRVIS